MNKTEALIFDFDGVILDSATIKTEAFLELFSEYPEHQKAILDYHIEHQGITRFKKFEWIYTELLKKPYNEEIKQRLGEEFTALVFEKILDADPLPGAIELLKTLRNKNIPAFVASGTPDDELHKIVESRGLAKYFETLYGSNISKEEAIDRVSEKKKFPYSKLLFIGDAITDYRAAKSRNVPFIAVYSPEMHGFWKDKNTKVVHNLMEIAEEPGYFEVK